jgi:hypothetical protein
MQHHNTATDHRAVENAGDSFRAFQPQLEQPAAKYFGMRLAQIRTHLNHPSRKHDIYLAFRVVGKASISTLTASL